MLRAKKPESIAKRPLREMTSEPEFFQLISLQQRDQNFNRLVSVALPFPKTTR